MAVTWAPQRSIPGRPQRVDADRLGHAVAQQDTIEHQAAQVRGMSDPG